MRPGGPSSLVSFAQRVLVAAAIAAAFVLLWGMRYALLLAFAAVIVATVLSAAAEPFRRWLRLPDRWATAAGGAAILLLLAGFGWSAWPQIRAQSLQLVDRLPGSVDQLEERLGRLPSPFDTMSPSTLLADIAQYFTSWTTTLLEVVGTLLLVVIAGGFLAAAPERYRRGVVALFPASVAPHAAQAMRAVGRALRRWLLAQLMSMAIVGVLIAAGAWAIGLPSPLALGLVAAIAEFVPIVGPVAASVPALLVALGQGLHPFLWTILLFLVVQQVESNIIMPLAGQEMVSIPPAVVLLGIAAMGALFGTVGVLLGTPMTVAAYALVREVYVPALRARRDGGGGGEG